MPDAQDLRPPHLVFTLDDRLFALPLDRVRQVTRAAQPRPVPGGPSLLLGLVCLRGEMRPLISLRRRLGLPDRPLRPGDRLLFVQGRGRDLALVVDEVTDTDRRFDDSWTTMDALWPGVRWFGGAARLDGGVAVIHDLDRLLSPDEEEALDVALAGA